MDNDDYNMVVTLLQYNADTACVVSKTGDSLLHEALKQMFTTGSLHRSILNSFSEGKLAISIFVTISRPHFLPFVETFSTTSNSNNLFLKEKKISRVGSGSVFQSLKTL